MDASKSNNANKKFALGIFSGVLLGVIGSTLLTPNQRENISRTFTYQSKKIFLNFVSFLNDFRLKREYPKKIQEESKKMILFSKNKANKIISDIDQMITEIKKL